MPYMVNDFMALLVPFALFFPAAAIATFMMGYWVGRASNKK